MEIRPILSALLRSKTAPLLVALQVAISLAILANALYVVNLRHASSQRPSRLGGRGERDHDHRAPGEAADARRSARAAEARRRGRCARCRASLPATWISQMPMSRSGSNSGFALDRKQARQSIVLSTLLRAARRRSTSLGLKLVEGRDITERRHGRVRRARTTRRPRRGRASIILTKAAAEQLYPGHQRRRQDASTTAPATTRRRCA